jgi:YD repeat-containing protein
MKTATVLRSCVPFNPSPMPAHTTTYARDLLGRPLSITGPDAQSVGVGYDAMGRTGSITPPGRAAHGFSYSPVNGTQVAVKPRRPSCGWRTHGPS